MTLSTLDHNKCRVFVMCMTDVDGAGQVLEQVDIPWLLNSPVNSCTRHNTGLARQELGKAAQGPVVGVDRKGSPEREFVFLTGVIQAGKDIPASSPIFRTGAAADLSLDDIFSDIPFAEIVVE